MDRDERTTRHNPHVRQLRVVVEADDYDEAARFYRDVLGMREEAAFSGDGDARVVILDAGRATLHRRPGTPGGTLDEVEVGRPVAPKIRLAFEVDDAREGAPAARWAPRQQEVAPPTLTPWESLNSRMDAPAWTAASRSSRSSGRRKADASCAVGRRQPVCDAVRRRRRAGGVRLALRSTGRRTARATRSCSGTAAACGWSPTPRLSAAGWRSTSCAASTRRPRCRPGHRRCSVEAPVDIVRRPGGRGARRRRRRDRRAWRPARRPPGRDPRLPARRREPRSVDDGDAVRDGHPDGGRRHRCRPAAGWRDGDRPYPSAVTAVHEAWCVRGGRRPSRWSPPPCGRRRRAW